ncbi:MAG: hypothetical protein WB760_07790 [Xanthobacteraceae bacterium]
MANFFAAAVIFGLFVLAAVASAERKDITQGFDEVAQASYVAHIQHSHDLWPAFDSLRMLDPKSFKFTSEANYLDHPPIFYALIAALGPELEGHPQAILAHRLINIAISALGLAALLGLGLAAGFSRYQYYAYAVPLACIPILAPLAGAINNDNLAFFGSALAMLGIWQLVATDRGGWLALALVGLVAAAWAKLTGLVLTGAMVSAVIAYLIWRRRWRWSWAIAVALAFLVAAAPYVVYMMQYGSPAPDTPAQIAMIENNARVLGLAGLPRKSFPAYFGFFVVAFVAEWMPTLSPRGIFNYAMLAMPVGALICAVAGVALSLRRLWQRQEMALDVVVIAGALSLAVTFALHVRHSYADHVATGWLMEAYPRYYLPLVAIVPLAGLSLLAAIEGPRWRKVLLGFLIAGPIAFELLGAPLG